MEEIQEKEQRTQQLSTNQTVAVNYLPVLSVDINFTSLNENYKLYKESLDYYSKELVNLLREKDKITKLEENLRNNIKKLMLTQSIMDFKQGHHIFQFRHTESMRLNKDLVIANYGLDGYKKCLKKSSSDALYVMDELTIATKRY